MSVKTTAAKRLRPTCQFSLETKFNELVETALKHNKRPLVLLAGGKLEDRQKLLEAFNEFELIGPGLKPSNKDLPPEQKSQFKSIGEIFNRYLNPR